MREGCRPRYSSLTFTQQTTHRSPSSSPHASCSLTSSLTSFSSTPLREYFQQTVHVRLTVKRSELLESMSPTLKAEVAWECNKEWLSRIWFLKGASQAFLVQLSLRLTAQVFAPGEIAPQGYMYIVHRGVALYGGKVFGAGESPWVRAACSGAWLLMLRRAGFVHSPSPCPPPAHHLAFSPHPPPCLLSSPSTLRSPPSVSALPLALPGRVWGEDMILTSKSLQKTYCARAMIFLSVFSLSVSTRVFWGSNYLPSALPPP